MAMPISDAEAVKFGLLVIYAEDMYVPGKTKPNPEPRIAQAGWEAIAYLTAKDALMPKRKSLLAGQKKLMGVGDVVFYGFLARNVTDPSSVRRSHSRHRRVRRMDHRRGLHTGSQSARTRHKGRTRFLGRL